MTTTTFKTASGSSSLGRGTSDDEEEKILDRDQKQKLASISEDEEEDEEEEGGNPLPTTQQQLEHALDQDNKAFQQLEQQQHDEELQDQEQAEQEQEDEEAVRAEQLRGERVEAAAIKAKECKRTPILQFWYGDSKDRTSIKWWCDAVDRIRDQKGWNNDAGKKPTASVDYLREKASLLMSIIAKGHQAAAVKDWSLMKPILIKGYSSIKTCTQRAK
jgi:TolA-binding protein